MLETAKGQGAPMTDHLAQSLRGRAEKLAEVFLCDKLPERFTEDELKRLVPKLAMLIEAASAKPPRRPPRRGRWNRR